MGGSAHQPARADYTKLHDGRRVQGVAATAILRRFRPYSVGQVWPVSRSLLVIRLSILWRCKKVIELPYPYEVIPSTGLRPQMTESGMLSGRVITRPRVAVGVANRGVGHTPKLMNGLP